MALFGNFKKSGRLNIDWGLTSEKQEKKSSLYEEAEKVFGQDKKLMMFIGMFLKGCREKHRYPTRQAWKMQLSMLEKLSTADRINSVDRAVKYGYMSMVYEDSIKKNSQNKVNRKPEDESKIVNIGF